VIDDPFCVRVHRVVDVEPSGVTRGKDVQQGIEQHDGLAMQLATVRLMQGTGQRLDGLVVGEGRRAHEVAGRRPDSTRRQETAGNEAMQRPPPRCGNAGVDHLLDQRVVDLIGEHRTEMELSQ
jgi:hypothetical protein